MKETRYTVQGTLWLYPSEKGSWHFVTVPKTVTAQINKQYGHMKRKWGSLPCEVSLLHTVWKTSLFPDSKSGTYILPIKASVRNKEGITTGDAVVCTLHITV